VGETVACVVPALNAAASVGAVLEGLRGALPAAVLVGVDDGSSDATGEILRRGCDHVVTHPANVGKGAALRAGFDIAVSIGAAAIVTIDADGQHDPAATGTLLNALEGADIVIGARRRDSGMPFGRRLTNGMSAAAVSHCIGQRVPDSQSGFRAIRTEVVRTVRPTGNRYEFETAFLILAARAGFRIASVPVATLYGAPSHFRPLRDAASVIRTIWNHRPAAMARCAS
jgi:glycosyltransferase involved in cell wall biosynthesis